MLESVWEDARKQSNILSQVLERDIPNYTTVYADALSPSPVSVSTITMACTTNIGRIHAYKLRMYIQDVDEHALGENVCLKPTTMGTSSVIFKTSVEGLNVAVKVFTTGCFHITGVRSPIQAVTLTQSICDRIQSLIEKAPSIWEDSKTPLDQLKVTGFSVCMINSSFSMPWSFRLVEAKEAWDTSPKFSVLAKQTKLDLEKHPGFQINLGYASVFIFMTGKFIVTGAKHGESLLKAYKVMCDFVNDFKSSLCLPLVSVPKVKGKRGRKRKAEADAFYENFGL